MTTAKKKQKRRTKIKIKMAMANHRLLLFISLGCDTCARMCANRCWFLLFRFILANSTGIVYVFSLHREIRIFTNGILSLSLIRTLLIFDCMVCIHACILQNDVCRSPRTATSLMNENIWKCFILLLLSLMPLSRLRSMFV